MTQASRLSLHTWRWLTPAIVLGLLIYRLAVIIATELPLFYDEAYYLGWAQTLEWGYYSKPPMVAWLIALTTGLFGHGEWAVKLAAPVLYTATVPVVFAIAARLFDRPTAHLSALIFATLPIVSFNSLFITTDAPLLFFWALTAWLFLRGMDSGHWRWWLLAGLTGGLGLLSKYTMILFPVSVLLYLAISPQQRHWLRSPKLWTTMVLAALIYLPNLYWNYQHDFVSFTHTAEISQLDRQLFNLDHFLEFFGAQFAVAGPVIMVFFLLAAVTVRSWKDDRLRFLLALALPFLVAISVQALLARANANWAAPSYVTAVIAAAVWLRTVRIGWLAASFAINLTLMVGLYHYHSFAQLFGAELRRSNDPYQRILGWRELGEQLQPHLAAHPDAILASDTRKLLAYLGYYAQPMQLDGVVWNPRGLMRNHYDLMTDMRDYTGEDFIFVAQQPMQERFGDAFAQVKDLGTIAVTPYPDLNRTLYVYYVRDFRGYPQ